MNYRHAYHAGNFADVIKHIALVMVLRHLGKKDKPFRVIDTHAGPGFYHLRGDAAQRTGEAAAGIDRLRLALGAGGNSTPGQDQYQDPGRYQAPGQRPSQDNDADRLLIDYIAIVDDAINRCLNQRTPGAEVSPREDFYPGSPLIARQLLRTSDRLHVNELHPEDAGRLKGYFSRDARAVVTTRDGFEILKATLPPRERRGVVLIDPPFEKPGEYDRLVTGLLEARRRFATGIFVVWYPVKDRPSVDRFYRSVEDHVCGKRHGDAKAGAKTAHETTISALEFALAGSDQDTRLRRTGLLIVNPPYKFTETYRAVLVRLAQLIDGSCGDWIQLDPKTAQKR